MMLGNVIPDHVTLFWGDGDWEKKIVQLSKSPKCADGIFCNYINPVGITVLQQQFLETMIVIMKINVTKTEMW